MTCNEAETLIHAYADGETGLLQTRLVRRHLRACAHCAGRHDELVALRARLHAEVPRYAAPPALRARVMAAAEAQGRTATGRVEAGWPWRRSIGAALGRAAGGAPAVRSQRWRWLTAGALAGCAATLLVWFAGTAVLDWRTNEDLAAEAVTSHVRATLGNQLIQVASSNQHTVKPWLSSRLDYSPPVPDLAQEGFTLLGGRIDYLDRHPVATLVYRIRDHDIDVFVRPESPRTAPQPLRTVRGFNVARATGSAMEWIAVSDVSADTLASFVETLARAGSR